MIQQSHNVVIGGAAGVYRKARVLFAYLRAADGVALEAALVYESRGIAAHRALEGAARGGHIQRLAVSALLVHLPHPRRDGVRIVGGEPEHGAHDGAAHSFKITVSIGKAAVFALDLRQRLVGDVIHDDALYDVLHLPAVGARVHQYAAADGARNAGGKLQSAQPVCLRKLRKLCKRHARLGVDRVLLLAQAYFLEIFRAYDHDVKPFLGNDEVRALAHHQGRDIVHVQVKHHLGHLENVLGRCVGPDLAADPERAVPAH